MSKLPYFIANRPVVGTEGLTVLNKFSNERMAVVSLAPKSAIDEAIAESVKATEPLRKMSSYQRKAVLEFCVEKFEQRAQEFTLVLSQEAGKTMKEAQVEVLRFIETFKLAAEESTRQVGEYLPLDLNPRSKGYRGVWKRVPIGPCSFISPFNFPLNLVAHKIAPALAVGCPFILKPASLTPVSAVMIGEVLCQAELPPGTFSILPCSREGADLFTTDDRLKLLSFTGSPAVGWELKKRAGKKKVVLELGGNAAVVIDEDADLNFTAERIAFGAFYQAGQSCISVQRIYAHEKIYSSFKDLLVEKTKKLKMGDPSKEETFLGPLISETEAKRVETWVGNAVKSGGKLLCGGKRQGVFYEPTLLENVKSQEKVSCEEVFGPVAVMESFSDFSTVIKKINDSTFGLQAGIFTKSLPKSLQAWDELEVGGVVIGDIPSWRADHMPYGGVKDSGLGREGVRFAMEEMTEIRLLVIRD